MKENKSYRDDRVTVAICLDATSKAGCYNDACIYATDDHQTLRFNSPHEILNMPNNALFKFDKVFDELDD